MNSYRKTQYVLHVLRGLRQKFKPLSEKQYNALCNRIELSIFVDGLKIVKK
jgi:hypothetical protein